MTKFSSLGRVMGSSSGRTNCLAPPKAYVRSVDLSQPGRGGAAGRSAAVRHCWRRWPRLFLPAPLGAMGEARHEGAAVLVAWWRQVLKLPHDLVPLVLRRPVVAMSVVRAHLGDAWAGARRQLTLVTLDGDDWWEKAYHLLTP